MQYYGTFYCELELHHLTKPIRIHRQRIAPKTIEHALSFGALASRSKRHEQGQEMFLGRVRAHGVGRYLSVAGEQINIVRG